MPARAQSPSSRRASSRRSITQSTSTAENLIGRLWLDWITATEELVSGALDSRYGHPTGSPLVSRYGQSAKTPPTVPEAKSAVSRNNPFRTSPQNDRTPKQNYRTWNQTEKR